VRRLVRLFRRKTVDALPPTAAAKAEIPMRPPVAPKEVAVRPAATAVQRAVTVVLKVALSVVETAVVLSRGLPSAQSLSGIASAPLSLSPRLFCALSHALYPRPLHHG